MNINKNNKLNIQNLSFTGHRVTQDKCGKTKHNFYYLYDSSKYECEVELYNIAKDKQGNYSIAEKTPVLTFDMVDGGITKDLSKCDEIKSEHGFAYRFKLTDRSNPNNVSYGFDNGTVIGLFKQVDKKEMVNDSETFPWSDYTIPEEIRKLGSSEKIEEFKEKKIKAKSFTIPDEDVSNKFNVVLNNRAVINKNGPMQLIMPDEYYPGVDGTKDASGRYLVNKPLRGVARKLTRNHANKLGGKLAGIIYRLPEIRKEGVKRIVGTPFTKDTISSHLYWTENAFQVAPNLGTENDFKELQVELFKNDINWIADAALVNQGLGGVHISEVLRKGDGATTKKMFRTQEKISLGILPDKAQEKGYTRMKMINAPFVISSDGEQISENKSYNPKKPTYIQFYDDRLASEKQKKSQSPKELSTYDIKNTNNLYDITQHDDAVYPFSLEVNPKELEDNVKREIEHQGKVGLASGYSNTLSDVESMKRVAEFAHFSVGIKEKAGGMELWDGNVDIPKLNFFRATDDDSSYADLLNADSDDNVETFERGNLAARDYAVASGKYWTQLTADTQLQYVSKLLAEKRGSADGYMSVLQEAVKNGDLPSSVTSAVDEQVVKNVQRGKYKSIRLKSADVRSYMSKEDGANDYTLHDYITKKIMDMPLETLPVSTNLLGILTTPYIAKRANVNEEIGISRFDLSSVGNPNLPQKYRATYERMDGVYNEIANKIYMLASEIDGVRDEKGDVTDYGRYVITELAPDLTKYMLLKSLNADANIIVDKNGNFDFSKVNEEEITMQSIGIPYNGMSATEEAEVVLMTLEQGLSKLNTEQLEDKLVRRFKNRSLDDFRMAEMILDRTEAGLGWRIDAAKDVGSIDGVRAGVDVIDNVWNQVVDFWKAYTQTVLSVNPHAYTTAEITDLGSLFNLRGPYYQMSEAERDTIKYKSEGEAERKFLEETGITSIANYNYFFSLMPELFAPNSFEHGGANGASRQEKNTELMNKLDLGWTPYNENNPGFLFNSPADGVENSYTFFGNHDKPRPLHGLVLNTNLFNFDFKKLDENSVHAAIDAVKKGIPEWAWKRVFVGNDGGDALPEKFVKEGKDFLEKLEKDGTGNSIKENINLIIDCIEKVGKEYFESIDKEEGKDYLVTSAPGWRKDSLSSLEYYEIAADVLQVTKIVDGKEVLKNIDEISFDDVNAMAVAMGHRLNEAFAKVLENNPNLNAETKKSVATLASGEHKGSKFDPTAFGTRPFDIAIRTVLDETEYRTGEKIKDRENIEIDVLKDLLTPAYDRYISMYKLLSTIPGSPTDFAGDRVGASGYESKSKNYHQQNRNTINWEWLEDERYDFIRKNYENVNSIANLRSRSELSALNDGATISAQLKDSNDKVQSMIRYNNKGSVVVSFHDLTGASTPLKEPMKRGRTISDGNKRVYFANVDGNARRGLKFGLEEGMILKNALDLDEADSPYYKVGSDNGSYYVEKYDGRTGAKLDISIEPQDYNTLLLCKV